MITGAAHGIGRELALQLSDLGVGVVCWDINEKGCQDTVREIKARGKGRRAWHVKCDVADRQQVAKAVEETR